MRASLPPTARPVATAAVVLVAAVLVPLAITSTALAERWLRPVPGEVARPFSYAREAPFAAGAHRGVDLVAPPGTAVRRGVRRTCDPRGSRRGTRRRREHALRVAPRELSAACARGGACRLPGAAGRVDRHRRGRPRRPASGRATGGRSVRLRRPDAAARAAGEPMVANSAGHAATKARVAGPGPSRIDPSHRRAAHRWCRTRRPVRSSFLPLAQTSHAQTPHPGRSGPASGCCSPVRPVGTVTVRRRRLAARRVAEAHATS